MLCMRLMCTQKEAEVEVLRKELSKAGIASEKRDNPVAKALGVPGFELWVLDERDFCEAARLYDELRTRTAGKNGGATVEPPSEASKPPATAVLPALQQNSQPDGDASDADPRLPGEPCRADLRQASTFLEKGIEEMIQHEGELAEECESLRSKVEELTQALAHERATLAGEAERKKTAEANQAEQISGLVSALERERRNWEKQLKSRDDQLKQTKAELETMSGLFEDQQSAAATLTQAITALEMQREDYERSLAEARHEAAEEQGARLAAEERAERATLAQESLEKELARHRELEEQILAYVASLSALCSRVGIEERLVISGSQTPGLQTYSMP